MTKTIEIMLQSRLIRPLSDLLNLFFPDLCVACSKKLLFHEMYFCVKCKHLLPKSNTIHRSENRAEKLFYGRIPLNAVASGFTYSKHGGVQQILHRIKYAGAKDSALELGRHFGLAIKNSNRFSDCDCIVPVPLHPKKKRTRGYNQTMFIAKGLSEALDLPIQNKVLIRKTHKKSQTTKSRYDRWENVYNDFAVSKSKGLMGSHVLLVDDVLTTGATIESCARPLLAIEGLELSVFTLAIADKF